MKIVLEKRLKATESEYEKIRERKSKIKSKKEKQNRKMSTKMNSKRDFCIYKSLSAVLLTVSLLVLQSVSARGSCQTVCACKWKGGKQTVECIDRALITIPENIDANTQVLDMSGNNLQILPRDTFIRAGLVNLQKVYLRNCRLGQIDNEAFNGLTNLVELDLSHNLLTTIPSASLVHIPSLRDLTLASNPIQKVDSHIFKATHSLTKLDLSHCDIQTIAPDAFKGLTSLHSLKLNGNKLTELRPRTIETLSKLHNVELHDNPWLCDCRLRAAKLWLTQNNIPYPVAPICTGGPERVIDRSFAELNVDDFACKPEMLPMSRFVEAVAGENATVTCRATAVPAANINWYWNGRLLINGSSFSSYQKVHIIEDGEFEKRSRLILATAQETDSGEFYCVAENRAGSTEANFTLHVSMRAAGMASLGGSQIVGLSAALIILMLFILATSMFLLLRVRRIPFSESKTPGHLEVITTVSPQPTANGKPCNNLYVDTTNSNAVAASGERKLSNEMKVTTNPVQKPPRLTELSYSTTHYDGSGSVITANAGLYVSPTASAGNNPDLINDTKRLGSGEFNPLGVDAANLQIPTTSTSEGTERHNSGEYSRVGSDSLYPSGLWEQTNLSSTQQLQQLQQQQHSLAAAAQDLYLKRAASATLHGYKTGAYSEKAPIIENSLAINLDDETSSAEFMSRTFPRSTVAQHLSHHQQLPSTQQTTQLQHQPHHSSIDHSLMNNNKFTANNNNSNTMSGGYPSDYGLPIVAGAEHHKSREMLPPSGISNAKTLRVWQKGGVPVLPPVTALKRALTSSRNSPDEGYQEGCGTDV